MGARCRPRVENSRSDARPDDLPAVRALIVAGLTQRWGSYLHSANPDLEHRAHLPHR
jgi:hypothetical protein